MSTLINLVVGLITAVTTLLELKLRLVRRSFVRLGWALAFIALAAFLLLAAVGFLLIGLYQYLSSFISPPGASLFVALVALVLALLFAFFAKSRAGDA